MLGKPHAQGWQMDNTGRDAGALSSKAKLCNLQHQIIDADQVIGNSTYAPTSPGPYNDEPRISHPALPHPHSLTTGRRVRSRESPGDYIVRFMREMEEGTRLNIHKLRYGSSTINEDNIRTLEKYDNRLPKTYEQKVNHLIKEIAREAGITEKVEVSYIENGEKKSRQVEKCDLVKTHTARRSGATNMYLAGIPTTPS